MSKRTQHLVVEIHDGRLSISIGVDVLAWAAEHCDDLLELTQDGFMGPKVIDSNQFAKDILEALLDEAEDGTTLVHDMLDQAFVDAVEAGSLGVAEKWGPMSEKPGPSD